MWTHKFSPQLGKHQDVIATSHGKSGLVLSETVELFPKLDRLVFPPATTAVPVAPHPYRLRVVRGFGHSNRGAVVSHCFNSHFPDGTCCGASFPACVCMSLCLCMSVCVSVCIRVCVRTYLCVHSQSCHSGGASAKAEIRLTGVGGVLAGECRDRRRLRAGKAASGVRTRSPRL